MVLSMEMGRGYRRICHLSSHTECHAKRDLVGRVLDDSDSRDANASRTTGHGGRGCRAVPIQQVQGGGERPQSAIQEIREIGVT